MEDVAALVEVSRDPALRQWASSVVDNDAEGTRWVQAQQQGWAAGDRFGFAVLEAQPGSVREQLVGNVVLKSRYDFDTILPAAPPSFPRDGHLHIRRTSA
jgi:hypothetical protein